ncbi:hypothetical protein ABI59_24010 [Acidobacteria bacterium Mor1]|nr:hypothetical protein ABI59_24010 [Acidobacteria bacterium Mor1]
MRIIGGTARGRRIEVPPGPAVRPTGDRVRESLFNILQQVVPGCRVLDAFAGSGALGLEALSRGAIHGVFIENGPGVLPTLRSNIEVLGFADVAEVWAQPVARALAGARPQQPFDLVLADPPYDDPGALGFLEPLAAGGWLAPEGLVVVERERGSEGLEPPAGLRKTRSQRYGRVLLEFLEPLASS